MTVSIQGNPIKKGEFSSTASFAILWEQLNFIFSFRGQKCPGSNFLKRCKNGTGLKINLNFFSELGPNLCLTLHLIAKQRAVFIHFPLKKKYPTTGENCIPNACVCIWQISDHFYLARHIVPNPCTQIHCGRKSGQKALGKIPFKS